MHARSIYLGVGLISVAAVSIAVALQEAWQLSACTWCIIQRYLYLGLAGFCFLSAANSGRQPWLMAMPILFSGAGIFAAARNTWVLYVPSFTCGRDRLAAAVNELPTAQTWPTVFEANGLCSESGAQIAGVPFPVLSFITFASLLLALVIAHRLSTRERSGA